MPDWLHRQIPNGWSTSHFFWVMGIATVATAVVSLIMVGLVVVRIPHDYFRGDHPPAMWADRHPMIRYPLHVFKNLLGIVLVVLGIVLSLPGVPGQGLLTILIGAMLIDFPGKRKCEQWLLRRRGVLSAINKLRATAGRPPLEVDPAPTPTDGA